MNSLGLAKAVRPEVCVSHFHLDTSRGARLFGRTRLFFLSAAGAKKIVVRRESKSKRCQGLSYMLHNVMSLLKESSSPKLQYWNP